MRRVWMIQLFLGICVSNFDWAHAEESQVTFATGERLALRYTTPVPGADPTGPYFIEKAEWSLFGLPSRSKIKWIFQSKCIDVALGTERSSHSIRSESWSDDQGELTESLTHAGRNHVISFLVQPRREPTAVNCKQSFQVLVEGKVLITQQGSDAVLFNL